MQCLVYNDSKLITLLQCLCFSKFYSVLLYLNTEKERSLQSLFFWFSVLLLDEHFSKVIQRVQQIFIIGITLSIKEHIT